MPSIIPKKTVVGRTAYMCEKTGKVLCAVSRDGNPCLSGGRLERYESPVETAVRESMEEIGIRPLNMYQIGDPVNLPVMNNRTDLSFLYLCTKWTNDHSIFGINGDQRETSFISVDELVDHHIPRVNNIWQHIYWREYSAMIINAIEWVKTHNINLLPDVCPVNFIPEHIILPDMIELIWDWTKKIIRGAKDLILPPGHTYENLCW